MNESNQTLGTGVEFNEYEQYIPLLLRVTIAFLWIWMAVVPKMIFPEPRFGMVSKSWVMPLMPISPQMLVYSLAVVELFLGVLLLIGLWTRVVSAIQIALTVIFIIGLVNLAAAQGLTSPLTHLLLKDIPLIAGSLVLIITGGGAYSIDRRRKNSSPGWMV
jgi:uncharacterized membrane protein YphA (DoxX/SURF4 family)